VARIFLQRALQGEDLSYHGSGSRMQDFVYVDDVAEAALDGLRAGRSGVFNVASGEPVTMKELAELVTELVAPEVRVVGSGQPDPQEGQTARYSIDAARRVLGWAPATALRRGLQLWRDRLAQASP
jgi:nucleoside-diphosphate-sugar epimerase